MTSQTLRQSVICLLKRNHFLVETYQFIHEKNQNRKLKIRYSVRSGTLSVHCPRSFDDRCVKSLELFMLAFERAKSEIRNSFRLTLCVGDKPDRIRKKRMFAYCRADDQKDVILFPDFSFVNWWQTGMDNYEECIREILAASEKEPEYDTLFWIGNADTHPSREILCRMAEIDPRIEAYGMKWAVKDGRPAPVKFVSLTDHTRYRYLIDVQGRGWSARTKVLLFTGRCLFLADRKWKDYWYEWIKPFVHYIPVKEDLSDLSEKLDWAQAHPEETQRIAENAKQFAVKHLTRDAAVSYLQKLLIAYANHEDCTDGLQFATESGTEE